jgi:hypothetical protein
MPDVKEITRKIVLRVEKEETEGHGAYCSADADEMGFEYDGHLNVEEIVEWVLDMVKNA